MARSKNCAARSGSESWMELLRARRAFGSRRIHAAKPAELSVSPNIQLTNSLRFFALMLDQRRDLLELRMHAGNRTVESPGVSEPSRARPRRRPLKSFPHTTHAPPQPTSSPSV